ncbi:MAG: DUF952 domain-containing protein [Rhizobiaceae bacterium]
MTLIYKILSRAEWEVAAAVGVFHGSAVDIQDGFIHFSTAGQMKETAARYFGGQQDLVLVAFDGAQFGKELVFEPSRGGALFPHLYAPLATSLAVSVDELPVGPDGAHVFPAHAK